MTKSYGSNKSLIIALIIALLLHILISSLLFLKFENFEADKKNQITQKEDITQKLRELLNQKKEVSKLTPAPYNAPVIYYDEEEISETKKNDAPENQEVNIDKTKEELKSETQEIKNQKDNINKKVQEIKKKIEEKVKKDKKDDATYKSEKESDRIVINKKKPQVGAEKKEKTEELKKENKISEEKISERIVPNQNPTLKISEQKIDPNKQQTPKIYSPKKDVEAKLQNPNSISKLAALTQGFVQYMNQEGNNQFLERDGNSDKFDPHEAKLVSYYNKIISFFHRSSRRNFDEFNRLIDRYITINPGEAKISVGLKLIINKDGSLADIIIMQNSGFNDYDNHIIRVFENAAPFPPVPDHLSKDELVFPINIYTPLGISGFSLRIG